MAGAGSNMQGPGGSNRRQGFARKPLHLPFPFSVPTAPNWSMDPVSMIAFEVGFDDLATFNRRFRRLIGVTPSAFRAGAARGGSAGEWV